MIVGDPIEVVRALTRKYVDQARLDFDSYVHATLQGSLVSGGRFNASGTFGALYCASDEATAWEEIATRYRREGLTSLPPEMGLLDLVIQEGTLIDLTEADTVKIWGFDDRALVATNPTPAEVSYCHEVGNSVRMVADVLLAPSARAHGKNVPVFPDRERSTLRMTLARARVATPPPHLLATPLEKW